jgi:hypothetical protein
MHFAARASLILHYIACHVLKHDVKTLPVAGNMEFILHMCQVSDAVNR